jgi:phosphate transport system protein
MKQFESALAELKGQVVDMGALAESMARNSWEAIVRSDPAARDRVLASEPRLDRCQLDIDEDSVRLIARYAPVARDLRCLLMIARITTELERMGDHAVDNCEYGALLGDGLPLGEELPAMADCVLGMVRQALEAFEAEDPGTGEAVLQRDDRVDALYTRVFHRAVEEAPAVPDSRARSTALVLLARSLERIADHATNICEEVIYLVKGADIRHPSAGGGGVRR